MTDCPDCQAAATNWAYGGYRPLACPGCHVRLIAAMPEQIRRQYLAGREQMAGEVEAEIARVARLRVGGA